MLSASRASPGARALQLVNGKLSWRSSNHAGHSKASANKAEAQSIKTSKDRSGNVYINVDEVKSWSDDVSGIRPGRNIEDVERSAMDHLFQGGKSINYEYELWKSPLRNIRKHLESQRTPKEVTPEDVLHATTTTEESTFIDPITNRRTLKKSTPTTSKYEDLDKYGPVVDEQAASQPEGKEKYTDLDKYGPVLDGEKTPSKSKQEEYNDLDKYGPVRWNEPNGQQKPTPEEKSKDYKDLHKYSSSTSDGPCTQRNPTTEEQSKVYNDLNKYDPVYWNEPDGLRKQTSEELSKDYDDVFKYNAVRWNEPDGLAKPTPEELSKNYQDVGQYGPVAWSEPNGLRKLTPEEESKRYDDLHVYKSPFIAHDAVLQAHEAAQMDATPKAEPLAAKVPVEAEDPAREYKDLEKYGPVRWNEPDGLRTPTSEELSKDYDDLHLYGAARWNEPDGLRKLMPEETSKNYRDLSGYAPRDLHTTPVRRHPEEESKKYKDLGKYAQYENGDSTPYTHPEEASKQYDDLNLYSGFNTANSGIHPGSASYEDSTEYSTTRFQELGKTRQVHPEELTKDYKDLEQYEAPVLDPTSRAYPVHPEEASKQYPDLKDYKHDSVFTPFASSTGKGPAGTGSKAGSKDAQDGSSFTHQTRRNRYSADLTDSNVGDVDMLSARDIRASTLRKTSQGRQNQKLEDSKAEHDSSWDAATADARRTLRMPKADPPKRLTGNYARDFPEDFETSWSTTNSPSKTTLFPQNQAESIAAATQGIGVQNDMPDANDFASMDESFPVEGSRLLTSLERGAVKRQSKAQDLSDPYSKVPQGLETSFTEECGGKSTWPALVKHYNAKGARKEAEESSSTDGPASQAENFSHKVLAYDPDTQTVSIAETHSTVGSTISPSPADILLKLSHPSKFLPYFGTLEQQGYEIASGGGDVLIFRQVRPASAVTIKEPVKMKPTRINPIDMMGKPVSGNFASPTGYVNYETLAQESYVKPEPPFRSVGYGEQEKLGHWEAEQKKQHKKKMGLGKKVVMGTVWVAGSAYAVGVVGEYFNTGRADNASSKRP